MVNDFNDAFHFSLDSELQGPALVGGLPRLAPLTCFAYSLRSFVFSLTERSLLRIRFLVKNYFHLFCRAGKNVLPLTAAP